MTSSRAFTSERDFQTEVKRVAKAHGWRVYAFSTYSLGMHKGWPDLVLIGHGQALFIELKGPYGSVSPAQHRVLEDLRSAGLTAEVWRASRWEHYRPVFCGPKPDECTVCRKEQ